MDNHKRLSVVLPSKNLGIHLCIHFLDLELLVHLWTVLMMLLCFSVVSLVEVPLSFLLVSLILTWPLSWLW
jgi:hypothetical protein